MRRKKLISPSKPPQDRIEYRFRLLFLPYLSYCVGISILGAFIGGIFFIVSLPITVAISSSIILLFCLLAIQVLLACILIIKTSKLILTSAGFSGLNLWCRRTHINWQEIRSIEHYHLLGMRCLSIKTVDSTNIQFQTRLYQTTQILDRVRQLARVEHILVRALEKELSRPRYELTKLWIGVIGSIALTVSIYLIGGNMYAAEQEKPLEQAIANYARQHPKTAPNQSAIELQALMTKLGLSVKVFSDGSKVKVTPKPAAIDEWKAIEMPLSTFVNKQLDKTEDSIEPIPNKLATYLKTHQADLDAIETHLATNPIPEWGIDGWIAQSDPKVEDSQLFSQLINFMSIANLENLTIVNLIDKQQQPNANLSRDLVAIEKIQQSISSQQSLMGQLISRVGESKISRLVRYIDSPQAKLNERLPQGWGDNLFGSDRHEYMISAIDYESINTNKFLQNAALFDRLLVAQESPLRFIPGLAYLVHPHLRLAAVDRQQEVTKGIAYWRKQNICRTDGKSGVKSMSNFDDYLISLMLLTNQYPKVLKQDLFWELTTGVRQVKAELAAGKKVELVAKDFRLQSQVCPGERWTAKATDKTVTISFSHPPDWKALGMSNSTKSESLRYTIKSID